LFFISKAKVSPCAHISSRFFLLLNSCRTEPEDINLLNRVVMNVHPNVLAHAAFIDRPRTFKKLYQVVGIVEEKLAVAQERQRLQSTGAGAHNPRGAPVLALRGPLQH
jgi:hypothetical protein